MPVGSGIAHRCEACGLGVLTHGEKFVFGPDGRETTFTFDPGSAEDALRELDRGREEDGSVVFENRDSLQCWITGGAWVALGTEHNYCFTPEAVTRLIATRDQVVTKIRWRPLRGIATTWQSGLNMFTFGQNVVLGAAGKAFRVAADRPWKRALDWFISAALAIPAIVVAVPLELIGMAFRKGGSARAQVQVL
jgi:hypothetical protein